MRKLIFSTVLLSGMCGAFGALASSDDEIVGNPGVIDAGTIRLDGETLRLWGIEAPPLDAECDLDGGQWKCGRQAAQSLRAMLNRTRLFCERVPAYDGPDYAKCRTAEHDISEWMVRNGWAVERAFYSDNAYSRAQTQAKIENLGVWRTDTFGVPW